MFEKAPLADKSTTQKIVVSRSDLPLHCPMPGRSAWSLHPKVYLPIEQQGHAQCPYCGAEYVLADDSHDQH